MELIHRTGDDATKGGLDLVLSLTGPESGRIGVEAALMADRILTAIGALDTLREPRPGDDEPMTAQADDRYQRIVTDLGVRLIPSLLGILNASIRQWAAAGASHGDLAEALSVTRSTAQSRRKHLLSRSPDLGEQWATGSLPPL